MRQVISGSKLREYMKKTVNLLCDTVSSTIGPTGNNILINNSDTSPFITNDGVTIAESIESDDIVVNTILEIIKAALPPMDFAAFLFAVYLFSSRSSRSSS